MKKRISMIALLFITILFSNVFASETLYHSEEGSTSSHSSTEFHFNGGGILQFFGKIENNAFWYAPQWPKNYSKVDILDYQNWEGKLWQARLLNDGFEIRQQGGSAWYPTSVLQYKTWDGSNWTMSRNSNPFLNRKQCDFSLSSDLNNQKCFGASGNQCAGGDPNHPVVKDEINCYAAGYVTIGSIMHDNCCYKNPGGYACSGSKWGWGADLAFGQLTGQSDRERCGQEWNKAVYESTGNRGWVEVFGPYVEGGSTDDLSPTTARDAIVYDSHGQFKRLWHEASPDDPARWGNDTDTPIQETVSTSELEAPSGHVFEFQQDTAFCNNGINSTKICE